MNLKSHKAFILTVIAVAVYATLTLTGTLPAFVHGGVIVGGVMFVMMYHYDQRQPSREEFLDMVREAVTEDFEVYLGLVDEDEEDGKLCSSVKGLRTLVVRRRKRR